MKKTLLSLSIICAAAFGLNAQVSGYAVGDVVDDFTVTDVHGNTHTLSDITASGKVVVIDFFFVDCPPCQSSAPTFSELHEKYGCNSSDVFCISIDTGDDDAYVQTFETNYAASTGFAPAPAISGTEGGGNAIVSNYGVGAFPTFTVIGTDMKILTLDIWPMTIPLIEAVISGAGYPLTPAACGAQASVNELTLDAVGVYPNPSNGNVTIDFNAGASSEITLEVTNLLGQVVYSEVSNVAAGLNTINLELTNLTEGQYLVNINDGVSAYTKKLQIKK